MATPLAISLQEAADLLSLKDRRTIQRYADHADLEAMRRAVG